MGIKDLLKKLSSNTNEDVEAQGLVANTHEDAAEDV